MTLKRQNDNDKIQHKLTPAELYILKWAKQRLDQPFCFLDFKNKYCHGTIRNAFSKLRKLGLIRLYCRSFCTFYVHSDSKLNSRNKPMTITHTVGKHNSRKVMFNLESLLDSLDWEDVCRVHNVDLNFTADGLYNYYLNEKKFPCNKISKDIQLPKTKWSTGRRLTIILHCTGKVSVYLKCSRCPIEVTVEGLVSLASFLGEIRAHLINSKAMWEVEIPHVEDWMVVQWHYGRDGRYEFSGLTLNLTFKTLCSNLARIYFKNIGNRLRGRVEITEEPNKTLSEVFEEKINMNSDFQKKSPRKKYSKR